MLKLASQSVRQRLSWLPSLVVFGFLLFAIVLADTRSAMAVPPPSLRMRAIPAFARKYGMPCSACHEAWPKLNNFLPFSSKPRIGQWRSASRPTGTEKASTRRT